MNFESIITYMYGISGLVGLAAYLPQIIKLIKNPSGRKGLSITTWGLWSVIGIFPFLYAAFIVKNIEMIIITGGNALFQILIFIMAVHGFILSRHEKKSINP